MPRPLLKPEIDHFLYRYFCLTCYLLYACDLWLLMAELLASFIHSFLWETMAHMSLVVSSVLVVRDAVSILPAASL